MSAIVDRLKREPALILGLIGALFALGAAFGFDLSTEQTGAITAPVVGSGSCPAWIARVPNACASYSAARRRRG